MGAVYSAEHPEIGKKVAIKVLAPHLLQIPAVTERFLAEARAVTRVRHPNIIDIYDFGRMGDGRPYFVMEMLAGSDLMAVIESAGKMSASQVVPYLEQIGAALQAAHDRNVVHRDLKPENIFVVEGDALHIKLLDFGIAKVLETQPGVSRTATGMVMGTPLVIAPEQAAAQPQRIGPRTDIYSLGIILYWMLAGRPPFQGNAPALLLASHIQDAPPPLRQLEPSVLPQIASLVERCLEKELEDRPASAAEVVAAFVDAVREDPDDAVAKADTAPEIRPPDDSHELPLYFLSPEVRQDSEREGADAAQCPDPVEEEDPSPTTAVLPVPPTLVVEQSDRRDVTDQGTKATKTSAKDPVGGKESQGLWGRVALYWHRARLTSKDPDVRIAAALAIAEQGGSQAITALAEAARNEDAGVRETAVIGLRHCRDEERLPLLMEAIRDEHANPASEAAKALVEAGPPHDLWGNVWFLVYDWSGLAPLRDAWPDSLEPVASVLRQWPDASARVKAVQFLGAREDQLATEPLLAAMQEDSDSDVRFEAALALAKIGDPRAFEPLLAAMQKVSDSYVRSQAAKALVKLEDPRRFEALCALLESSETELRQSAVIALGDLGDPRAVELLVRVLAQDVLQVRKEVPQALVSVGDSGAFERLRPILHDASESEEMKNEAAFALARLDLPASLWGNIWHLGLGGRFDRWFKYKREQVRNAVLEAGAADSFEPLVAALTSPAGSVSAEAFSLLVELDDPRTLPLLRSKLLDAPCSESIAEYLGQIGDEQALEPLCEALDGGNVAAARALGKLALPRSIEPLKRVLTGIGVEEHWFPAFGLLCEAACALLQFGPPASLWGHALLARAGNDDEQAAAPEAFREAGAVASFEPLKAALKRGCSEAPRFLIDSACFAADMLAELGGPQAEGPLQAALKATDAEVRVAAAKALGTLRDPSTLSSLCDALLDETDSVRKAVALALGELGQREATVPLQRALEDHCPSVGNAAAVSLIRLGHPGHFRRLREVLTGNDLGEAWAVAPMLISLGPPYDLWGYAFNDWREEDTGPEDDELDGFNDGFYGEYVTPQLPLDRFREAIRVAGVDAGLEALQAALETRHQLHVKNAVSAARMLGELNHPRASALLREALTDKIDLVRSAAASALGELGEDDRCALYCGALKDEDTDVRESAAQALSQMGNLSAVEPLSKALDDWYSGVREAAAHALGELGDPGVEDSLRKALKDSNSGVRKAARQALRKLGSR